MTGCGRRQDEENPGYVGNLGGEVGLILLAGKMGMSFKLVNILQNFWGTLSVNKMLSNHSIKAMGAKGTTY